MENKTLNDMPTEVNLNNVQNQEQEIVTNTQASSEVSSSPEKRKFNPLIVVIIFLLLVILGGTYYVYQKFLKLETLEEVEIVDDDKEDFIDNSEESQEEDEVVNENISYVKKDFVLTSSSELLGDVIMNNEMEIPSTWIYSTEPLPTGTLIKDCSKHIITSDDSKMVITITPKCSGFSSSVISNPGNDAVGMYTTVGNDGIRTVSIFRLGIDSTSYSYVQGSSVDGSAIEYTNIFLVQKHSDVLINEDPVFWGAEVNTQYIGDTINAESYLDISDQIVLSLQIK